MPVIHFIFILFICNSLTVGVYVTQLHSNVGTPVWQIVSVMTKCRFMNEVLSCMIVLQGQNYSTPIHPLHFKN